DGPRHRAGANDHRQLDTALRRQQLGIAQPLDLALRIENDRGRDDGPGQRAPAGFVDSRDQHATPAVRNSVITASAAIVAPSAASASASDAKSASVRRLVTASSYRFNAARAR